MADCRAEAAQTIKKVLSEGAAFDSAFIPQRLQSADPRDIGLYKELCFGAFRQFYFLDALTSSYVKKPLNKKDWDIRGLLVIGAYQLIFMRTPDHAALASTVEACKSLKKIWAKGLVNAILRNIIKLLKDIDRTDLEAVRDRCKKQVASEAFIYAHPEWLYEKIQHDFPNNVDSIISHNNSSPPMTIRVAQENFVTTVKTALEASGVKSKSSSLHPQTLVLEKAVNSLDLPGFADGATSIQDAGAQLTATLFNLSNSGAQKKVRVLDACAAPGGKTLQLLQDNESISMTALDINEQRLKQVEQNLARANCSAEVKVADAANLDSWWDGQPFDAILLDAPCSGSGVINRHPDIKLLRREDDIAGFASQQSRLLSALWQTLCPDGELVYCTCSIFKEENQQVIEKFVNQQDDAELCPLLFNWGLDTGSGRQLLPNIGENDGFFFAKIRKR